MKKASYAARKDLPGVSYEEAVERVTEELSEVGFGVLTEIDVKATLEEKLDEEFKKYVILGACNPHLAHRALSTEESIGLLLPCNVVVAETEDGSEVAFARPDVLLDLAGDGDLAPVADEAQQLLSKALERL